MSNKTLLAALTLGAAIALAGPAFAEKLTAKLDGKAEVPAPPLPAPAPPISTTTPRARSSAGS